MSSTLGESVKQKLNIIKLVKCYDFYQSKIYKNVALIEELENKDLDAEIKEKQLKIYNAEYMSAVLGMTETLRVFGNRIGLDVKNNVVFDKFMAKYKPIVVPENNDKNVYSRLNQKYNDLLGESINNINTSNVANEGGLINRQIAVISSAVESVYGKELEKPYTSFKIEEYVLRGSQPARKLGGTCSSRAQRCIRQRIEENRNTLDKSSRI